MDHTYRDHSQENGESTSMRLLIHYVGDVHQPLHATTRVNKQYPEGDKGGNLVHLPEKDGAKNLHAVWDSVIYEYTGRSELPLSDDDWQDLSTKAADLIKKYPISTSEANNLNP